MSGCAPPGGGLVVRVDDPFTRQQYCEAALLDEGALLAQVRAAQAAQAAWRKVPLGERLAATARFLEYWDKHADQVCRDITGQMGKPLGNSKGELRGLKERTVGLMDLAPGALSDVVLGATTNNKDTAKFHRAIVREPVGVVLTLAPWNFPLLTAVNSIVPAVLAGNAVLVNHGFRAPLMSEHFAKAWAHAGVPKGLVQSQKCDYSALHRAIRAGLFDFVSFTGSVAGGRAVNESVGLSSKFIDCTLELGGNDGCYVSPDADMAHAVENAVDGGLYNAGQSCCGIERVFVHESIYSEFTQRAIAEVARAYGAVGDPRDPKTAMGPVATPGALAHLSALVADATAKGARVLTGESKPVIADATSPRIFRPTLLADCNATMECMKEESFGPIISIQKVKSQDEAVQHINNSRYGLTAAIFTKDQKQARRFADAVQVGTVFMNRCDYLDPYQPWQGRKDTGKGLSLSQFGFHAFTKLKNHHFKTL